MEKIPKELPALMRAQKIQEKARKDGFDWDDISGAYEALSCEVNELKQAAQSDDVEQIENELGDVLFSCVNIARFLNVDAEQALTVSNDKFIKRYLIVEKLAAERSINMKETSIDKLDELWKEAKEKLESN